VRKLKADKADKVSILIRASSGMHNVKHSECEAHRNF